MISSQETENDFCDLYKGLSELTEKLDIEWEVGYVMMDSCDACYNATSKMLPNAKILMCFFHVMKNVKANCEKPLTPGQYIKFKHDVGLLHYSVSQADFEENVGKFKDAWDNKGTKNVFKYMDEQWFTGRWSVWQVFCNPPGWVNTNSNIESFNATIKRDHSLRRRYSVFGSVEIIIQMITYYSSQQMPFETLPRFNSKTKSHAQIHCSKVRYSQIGKNTYSYKNKFHINTIKRQCNCSDFLKNAVCAHILGYVYRHRHLDAQSWFGPKFQNKTEHFHHNMKRGAKKKNTGRYKNSEKALSAY